VRRSITPALCLLTTLSTAACSGGSGSEELLVSGGAGSSLLAATFAPDEPSPGPGSVAMALAASDAASVVVDFDVTDTAGIGSAGFEVWYDPARVQFLGWSIGDLFGSCTSGATLCLVNSSLPGRLLFGISVTQGGSVNAVGSRTLARVVLRAIEPGSSSVTFDNAALKDASETDIPGVAWHGGTISTN
jgi:hypothetical protein